MHDLTNIYVGNQVSAAEGKQMKNINLREQGIYLLPDGREFVAHAVFRGSYVLYTPGAWEFFGLHQYESDYSGRLLMRGQPTNWRVEDLSDTTRTARSRARGSGATLAPSVI